MQLRVYKKKLVQYRYCIVRMTNKSNNYNLSRNKQITFTFTALVAGQEINMLTIYFCMFESLK